MSDYQEILLNELTADSIGRRRFAAQELLKTAIREPASLDRIREIMASEADFEIQSMLKHLLAEAPSTSEELTAGCWEKDLEQRKKVVAGLPKRISTKESQELLRIWASREKDPGLLFSLLGRLRPFANDSDTSFLLDLLIHPWSGIRSRALAIVAEREPQRLAKHLPALLKSSDPRVRLDALKALDRLLPQEAGRLLREFLDSEDPETRIMALHAGFTFDFQQISMSIVRLLLCETDREALRLASLLAISNPDPEIAAQLFGMCEKVPPNRRLFLKNLSCSIMKGALLAGLLSTDRTWEEWLHIYSSQRIKSPSSHTEDAPPSPVAESVPPADVVSSTSSSEKPAGPETFEKNLSSTDPEIVIAAFESLKKKHVELIEPHLQFLLRHGDPRVRLRALILLQAYDPNDLRRELKGLLNSANVQFQREALKLAFLMEPELVTPLFLDKLGSENPPEILEKIHLYLITNPSMNSLKALIIKESVFVNGTVVSSELVGKVYESLKLVAGFPIPPLEKMLAKLVLPQTALSPEVAKLAASVKRIRGDSAEQTVWQDIARAFKATVFGNFRQLAGGLAGMFFLILAIRVLFLPPKTDSRRAEIPPPAPAAPRGPMPVIGKLLVIAKDKKSIMVRTKNGKVRVFGDILFSAQKPGTEVKMICAPGAPKQYGVQMVQFQEWLK